MTSKKEIRPLSLFERTKLIGYRAESIANGASINEKRIKKYCTKNNINMPTSAIELAEIEYILNIIPFNIKRTFPNGTIEILTL